VDDGVIHQTGDITQDQLVQNPSFVKGFMDNMYNYLQVRFDLDGNGAMLASAPDEVLKKEGFDPSTQLSTVLLFPSLMGNYKCRR
jgi:hypothetical protein